MIPALVYIAVFGVANLAFDSSPVEDLSSDIHRTIGVYAGLEYLDGRDDQYPGFSIAGFFKPFRWTEVGFGYSMLSTEEFTYSYVNSWAGIHSPRFWRFQLTGGVSDFIPVIVPSEFYADCSLQVDPSLRWSLSPFLGFDVLLQDNPLGYQYNLRTRVLFNDKSIERISVGCYILN